MEIYDRVGGGDSFGGIDLRVSPGQPTVVGRICGPGAGYDHSRRYEDGNFGEQGLQVITGRTARIERSSL